MPYINNPYAQGGWYNPQNPHSINNQPWPHHSSHPPTYGVLPFIEPAFPTNITFKLSPIEPDILSCCIIGPGSQTYLSAMTIQCSTIITKNNGDPVARIEWHTHPWVEIYNIVDRQPVSQWLLLSVDMSYRTMWVIGRIYKWVPHNGAILLKAAWPSQPGEQLGRITRKPDKVILELTAEAIHSGIFEAAAVATLLLQSGRNIA